MERKGLKIFIGLDGDTLLVIVGASLVLHRLLLSRPTFTPVLLFVHKDKSFLANTQTQFTTVRSTLNDYGSGRSCKARRPQIGWVKINEFMRKYL